MLVASLSSGSTKLTHLGTAGQNARTNYQDHASSSLAGHYGTLLEVTRTEPLTHISLLTISAQR